MEESPGREIQSSQAGTGHGKAVEDASPVAGGAVDGNRARSRSVDRKRCKTVGQSVHKVQALIGEITSKRVTNN